MCQQPLLLVHECLHNKSKLLKCIQQTLFFHNIYEKRIVDTVSIGLLRVSWCKTFHPIRQLSSWFLAAANRFSSLFSETFVVRESEISANLSTSFSEVSVRKKETDHNGLRAAVWFLDRFTVFNSVAWQVAFHHGIAKLCGSTRQKNCPHFYHRFREEGKVPPRSFTLCSIPKHENYVVRFTILRWRVRCMTKGYLLLILQRCTLVTF